MTVESLIVIISAAIIFIILFSTARATDKLILNMKLKEIDRMKDNFVSMVSHELRTPLTVIRGYIEILRSEENITKDGKKNLERIDKASSHLDTLIDDITEVSKIENGRIDFNPKIIDPVPVVHSVVSDFGPSASHKGLKLSLKVVSTANIYVDSSRLKQILKNLIKNAIKYTDNDSITVRINMEGGDLLISVIDTGIGISEEEQYKIFNKFYKSSNNEEKGTGLGLWITKELVSKMKGRISVKSKKGVGSQFTLRFPIVV